ncbi:MAG: hypothetical protein WBK46_08830, partial [Ruminococcus flavefaciens]
FKNTQTGRAPSMHKTSPTTQNRADRAMHFFEPLLCTFYLTNTDEYRIELMEFLRNAGFYIELMNESCQHYAVIDGELVWYGSMNLLSKDDIEDNIMRVSSKAIAAELLEMTFKKDNDLNEYQLPLNL